MLPQLYFSNKERNSNVYDSVKKKGGGYPGSPKIKRWSSSIAGDRYKGICCNQRIRFVLNTLNHLTLFRLSIDCPSTAKPGQHGPTFSLNVTE